MVTSISLFYGVIAILLYMTLQLCYYLDVRYRFNNDYIEAYYTALPTPEILTRNTDPDQSIIDPDDYIVPVTNPNNGLFQKNKALTDKKINFENGAYRNPLNKLILNDKAFLDPNQTSNKKVRPYVETFENAFNPIHNAF